jgi:hypothetical protein
MTPQNPPGPVQLEVDYPPKLNRWLPLVKWLLAIPHYIALTVLGIGMFFVLIAAWFVVLFTGRFPGGMFNYIVGVMRWGARVGAYVFLQTDAYPPFSLEDDPNYPVRLRIEYPSHIANWRPLVNWLLVIPAYIAAEVILLVAYLAAFCAFFAILFTTRYPESMFNSVVVAFRWALRVTTFEYWMTEAYPPFVWA